MDHSYYLRRLKAELAPRRTLLIRPMDGGAASVLAEGEHYIGSHPDSDVVVESTTEHRRFDLKITLSADRRTIQNLYKNAAITLNGKEFERVELTDDPYFLSIGESRYTLGFTTESAVQRSKPFLIRYFMPTLGAVVALYCLSSSQATEGIDEAESPYLCQEWSAESELEFNRYLEKDQLVYARESATCPRAWHRLLEIAIQSYPAAGRYRELSSLIAEAVAREDGMSPTVAEMLDEALRRNDQLREVMCERRSLCDTVKAYVGRYPRSR